jgi:hypothetical protein
VDKNSALGDNLEHLKDDVAARKVEVEKERAISAKALQDVQAQVEALTKSKHAMTEQFEALQKQYNELNATLATAQANHNNQIAALTQKAESLQKEVW